MLRTSYLLLFISLFIFSCTSDTVEEELLVSNTTTLSQTTDEIQDQEGFQELGEFDGIRGADGCTNVVVVNGYAYATCGASIQIAEVATDQRSSVAIAADDITVDPVNELLFIQRGTTIQMLTYENPFVPEVVATVSANFAIFSGLSAANCVLAVSGGAGGSNTQIFNYSASQGTLELATNGIPIVDNRTGAPDVFVRPVSGGAQGFYSQDLGNVANWGIQIVNFNGAGAVLSTPDVVVLTSGQFQGPFGAPFGPANFPVESEYLDGSLYVANFAAEGIEVIDLENNNALSQIPLGYEPTNIGTDGEFLFVVGVTNDEVTVIDPSSATVITTLGTLTEPTGVAANETHVAVADQSLGLVVIPRS
ncbi:hypothetical protein GCM10011344_08830 [Dokdonia pacifica]|uniref:40-residue YVTN family beta-propeller repeat-containing protein n=1 Tax=Dokdonia pacifica TaxID=1627892 RepID=A0A238YS83_9FLAO|nr:hypothetical protein [Dokdonia pacifica]GGG10382.1 hypothetical protein GCM10011344_08830 [Dokdonia pacifica]SNR73890.1 40-residue YVTN family beta-propeller repeat-containing protein [Dokdonia pacifica]